ncbi:ComEA family DNA-binding protein [Phycisphaerales bacterium AB-hyl4]|uniref:ComEA family DNA-binding protein n=1 Tax=Natronomicrosphaera hydrolytica TaxID=3242702 RepID=A0ABV4U573_9BACT
MPNSPAEPAADGPRWRYLPPIVVGLLVSAWLSLGLAYHRQPATAGDLTPTPSDYRVHLNDDDAIQLQLLPGIGPRLADHILVDRQQGGRFDRREALERVHRIGPRTVERIKPWITLDPLPPTEP